MVLSGDTKVNLKSNDPWGTFLFDLIAKINLSQWFLMIFLRLTRVLNGDCLLKSIFSGALRQDLHDVQAIGTVTGKGRYAKG